jgi:hypothetical protein
MHGRSGTKLPSYPTVRHFETISAASFCFLSPAYGCTTLWIRGRAGSWEASCNRVVWCSETWFSSSEGCMRWAAASWCRREVRDSIHRYMIPGGYALYAYANGGDDVFTGKTDQRKRSSTGINEFQTLCGVFFFLHLSVCSIMSPLLFKVQKERRKKAIESSSNSGADHLPLSSQYSL